jgi:hypothetical protein
LAAIGLTQATFVVRRCVPRNGGLSPSTFTIGPKGSSPNAILQEFEEAIPYGV